MIYSFFYRLIVGFRFIPRRSYHITTKKYKFFTRCLFQNNSFRKFIFNFANLFSDTSQIARSIRIRLFYLQQASIDSISRNEIDFAKNIYIIDYGTETRRALILKQNEKISTYLDVGLNNSLYIGMCILENIVNLFPKILECDIYINIEIFDPKNNKTKSLSFPLPIGEKKHGIMHNKLGESWFDFSVDLSGFNNEKVLVTLSTLIADNSFTMLGDKNYDLKKITLKPVPCVAFSVPKLIKRGLNNKKILLISGESLTDPFWLDKINKDPLNFPNIFNLSEDSTRYERSYSMVDSTLPSIMSYFSGLYPSQHSFGDYSNPIYQENPSAAIESLPGLLKNKGYTTICQTSYPRFDPLYGWDNGFDRYFQAEYPWSGNAPDASKVIRSFESLKHDDIFIFVHLTRLHGPFLSSDILQNPQLNKAEDLNSASNGNFHSLYGSQLKIFDDQIGAIVDYLKRTEQYKNTMIVLTGDHGVAMPPNWSGLESVAYAHYEEHSRVPLIIKSPDWFLDSPDTKCQPVSSQKKIFEKILESNGLSLPDYFLNLPQYRNEFKDYAICETVYHPDKDNYAISFISSTYKYWMFAKVDWESLKILSVLDEKLFKINDEDGVVNEDLNLISIRKEVAEDFKNKAMSFFNESSSYRNLHPPIKYPNTFN